MNKKSKPPAKGQVRLRLVAHGRENLILSSIVGGRQDGHRRPNPPPPPAKPAATKSAATGRPELRSKRRSMKLRRRHVEVATGSSRRRTEVRPRHARRAADRYDFARAISSAGRQYVLPPHPASLSAAHPSCLNRCRQIDDLAGSGVTVPERCVGAGRPQRDDLTAMAELDRRWRHDLRRPRKRNHFRLRRQLQGTLCVGTARELS